MRVLRARGVPVSRDTVPLLVRLSLASKGSEVLSPFLVGEEEEGVPEDESLPRRGERHASTRIGVGAK